MSLACQMRKAAQGLRPSTPEELAMTPFERALGLGATAAFFLNLGLSALGGGAQFGLLIVILLMVLASDFKLIDWPQGLTRGMVDGAIGGMAALYAIGLVLSLPSADAQAAAVAADQPPATPFAFWFAVIAFWLSAWLFIERISNAGRAGPTPRLTPPRYVRILAPVAFGLTLLLIWEIVTRAAGVPKIILPPPSMIIDTFMSSGATLWKDFEETFLKSVLAGYALGCGAGLLVGLVIDRSGFLKRGLLPIGNLFSALPIIGIAPITVIWFGPFWEARAAVVVAMTFFPMLVNTVAGLSAADRMQRDLMRTYAASYRQTLLSLRLPAAAPFIFNALKINSTLALIGAIVAEFFGSPTVGMGFRISSEVGRLNLDMVWSVIVVAAIAGVAFYAAVARIERAVTFWHPSMRK